VRINELGQPIGDPVDDWSPPPPPGTPVLAGRYCRLEPLSETHADALYRELHADAADGRWTYMSVGPFPGPEEFAAYVRAVVGDPATAAFAILDPGTGAPRGHACYLRVSPATGSIEVGSIIYGPSLRRTPAATEAMYLMARHAFDLGYRRYEWKCDALNAASRSAALRLGFAYEGTWRNALVYKGRNRDTAWYAMTDADWRVLRPAYERWLDPANFADGSQRTALSELTAKARATLDA